MSGRGGWGRQLSVLDAPVGPWSYELQKTELQVKVVKSVFMRRRCDAQMTQL